MKPILEVRDLWKQYKIGGQQASYLSLRERLLQPFQKQQTDTFWALQDINFDVYEGECIGIIGRNGAGKSTLLKILSQITPPTKGYIKARGRVASLLEVGTGFHPELTGRENVYLNGSILGLRRAEINAKFDEIVNFSGVEKFLDTPLKHYSSGMRLRLAFSVAAHLEPEILLIDEVLAVGDAEFQKKCLGKMDEVSKSGRTVIFVSHNLGAVKELCSKGILIDIGKTKYIGSIDSTLTKYNENTASVINKVIENILIIRRIALKDNKYNLCQVFNNSEKIFFEFHFELFKPLKNLKFNLYILKDGVEVINSFHNDINNIQFEIGNNLLQVQLPLFMFNEGTYFISLGISEHRKRWISTLHNITSFKISFNPIYKKGINERNSLLAPMLKWNKIN
jgi:lipopolysaccharide transport system ATP-binding protein